MTPIYTTRVAGFFSTSPHTTAQTFGGGDGQGTWIQGLFSMTAVTTDPQTITIKYYTCEGVGYLDQMHHPGPEPCSRMLLHMKTPQGVGLKRLRMDDLAYNNYVTTAWLDAYYHRKWWSAVDVFPMSGCVDHGYHWGKRLIGRLVCI